MKELLRGKYLGTNTNEKVVDNILLSQTFYSEGLKSDWHYHENPYFALILNGGSIEERIKHSIECVPGNLIFYNWQEPHKNVNYQDASCNFNVEFDHKWLRELDIDLSNYEGTFLVNDLDYKFLILKLLKEYKYPNSVSELEIQSLTLQLLSSITSAAQLKQRPLWLNKLYQLLNDQWNENFSLLELSQILNIHPVSISRYFPKYFNCTLGEYIRKVRVDRSLHLIKTTRFSLVHIAFECGFADQSHFIRVFKEHTGLLPKHFRDC